MRVRQRPRVMPPSNKEARRPRSPLRQVISTGAGRVVVEPALPEDAQACIELFLRVLGEGRYFVAEPSEYIVTVDSWRSKLAEVGRHANGCYFVARLRGVIVGVITVEGGRVRRRRHAAVLEIFLHPDVRGCGIGRQLMELGVRWARANPRLHKLNLAVFADNDRAVSLYTNMGFSIEGRRVGEYRERDGTLRDDLLMAMDVRSP